MNTDKRRCN